MCTMIVERAEITGSGKGKNGWFSLRQVNVSYDHPFHAPVEHAVNIDFVLMKHTHRNTIQWIVLCRPALDTNRHASEITGV